MLVKTQLRKKQSRYCFNCIAPVLMLGEIMILMLTDANERNKYEMSIIGVVVTVLMVILLFLHTITNHLFWKKIGKLQDNEKVLFEKKNLRIDRYVINEKFILEYGILRKKIIDMNEVEKAEFTSQHSKSYIRYLGNVSFDTNTITLIRKEKNPHVLKAPVNLFGNEAQDMTDAINDSLLGKGIDEKIKEYYETFSCEIPFYGILGICTIPVMKILVLLYPYIRDLFIDNQDKVKTVLFCIAYEERMEIIVFVLLLLFFVGMFYWKYCMQGLDYETGKHYLVLIGIPLIMMALKFYLPWDFCTYNKEFQEDYHAYKRQEFEMLEQELYDAGEITSSSCLYDAREIIERYDIDIRKVRYPDTIYAKDSLYLIDNDIELREGCIYQVKYLKNSRIIVEIQGVE